MALLHKEPYYLSQLRKALVAGEWESDTPAKASYGKPLNWQSLSHKFKKHCAQHVGLLEAALLTQNVSLLLAQGRLTARDLDGDSVNPDEALQLGDECRVPEERKEEIEKEVSALAKSDLASHDSVKVSLAYAAFALDRPQDCVSYLQEVSFSNAFDACRKSTSSRSTSTGRPPLFIPVISITANGNGTQENERNTADLTESQLLAIVEALRGLCLQGMSQEKLCPEEPARAFMYYDQGVDLLSSFSVPSSVPTKAGKANYDSFVQHREIWRWSERLLRRSIMLSSRHRPLPDVLRPLRVFANHSGHWPATFRPQRRSAISVLHLRALILLSAQYQKPGRANRAALTHEARSVVNEYRTVLSAISRFPKSGERNVVVEDFVDLCVAVWEAGGSGGDQTGWVIDILWWATRLTFHSQRIFRHMTRLTHISGDHELARRTLRLYVQLVSKSRETGEAWKDPQSGMDTNEQYIETLAHGARMLCRTATSAKDGRDAMALIARAREIVEPEQEELMAAIELADGVAKSIVALRDFEPEIRGDLLSESLGHFKRSVEICETAPAHFHYAVALSRPGLTRNLNEAIECARKAVEADAKEVRYWHLLALLTTKTGEWKKAKSVLQIAADIADDNEEPDALEDDNSTVNGVVARDYGKSGPQQQQPVENGVEPHGDAASAILLSPDTTALPPSSSLLKPVSEPAPSQRELFEHALQIRMTQLALTEFVDGAESAEPRWLEVFEWYAERRDTSAHARSSRQSIDGFISITSREAPSVSRPSMTGIQEDPQPEQHGEENLQVPTSPAKSAYEMDPIPEVENEKSRSSPQPARKKEDESERQRETAKGTKKVQRMLKDQVHKGQARFNTISKKIGNGVVRGAEGVGLHRSNSAPDIHAVLARAGPYQASSIHSRKRKLSWRSRSPTDMDSMSRVPSPIPPPPPPLPSDLKPNERNARERRLLSDLWLTSAATFRRLGKIEQARAAIQEAEVLDEENTAVWVQLGLYFDALGDEQRAIESLHKALFIHPDDCSAIVHLCRLYLSSQQASSHGGVDLAVGMLEDLTRGVGWDVPEAWYLLAKAYGMQDRKARERECLVFALGLVEARGVRDIGAAVGWCL